VAHRTRIQTQSVPGWVYHRPRCECGWDGDIVRTRAYADDQVDEHLAEHVTTYQPSLFEEFS